MTKPNPVTIHRDAHSLAAGIATRGLLYSCRPSRCAVRINGCN